MRSKPIPIPRGGFTSNEDEARWLADTIAMRASETLMAATGISSNWPTDSLYELLLDGLGAATRRARKEAEQAHDRRVSELLAAHTAEVERRREAEEEVAFWRREMLAKLQGLTAVLAAATAKGDQDRAAELRANHIMPILSAFRDARVKLWHDPCASCGDFIRPGTGYVYLGDASGSVHEGCAGEFGPVVKAQEFDEAAIIAAAAAAVNESVAADA